MPSLLPEGVDERKSFSLKKTPSIPRLRSTVLPRPRIMTLLSEILDFPLVVVKAGAGYGKTTALADWLHQSSCISQWLTIRSEHQDEVYFVQSLCETVFQESVPRSQWTRVAEAAHSPVTLLQSAIMAAQLTAAWVHEDRLLVLDDFHVLDGSASALQWMDSFLRNLPEEFHVALVSRTNPAVPWIDTLAEHGDVLWIRERDLSFTEAEVGMLFGQGMNQSSSFDFLTSSQVDWLRRRSAGMAMILSILFRDWRQYKSFSRLEKLLAARTSIQEIVGRLFVQNLTESEKQFLRKISLFPTVHGEMCDFVLCQKESEGLLREMERRGHIAFTEAGSYALHPLVRDYLAATLSAKEKQQMLERAVRWHLEKGEEAQAIPYLFQMDRKDFLMEALFQYIPRYLKRGQVSTVQNWLERLPPQTVETSGELLLARGEVARHTNGFAAALKFYDEAVVLAQTKATNRRLLAQIEMARARLYLDTIQPGLAVSHIHAARQWSERRDTGTRLRILQFEFENCINLGKIRRARRIRKILIAFQGAELPGNNSDLRLLLRTGHIAEVIEKLRARVANDSRNRSALAHREATLLLSLMYAMRGYGELAEEQARVGHSVGNSLQSPFVSAVGYIRLGHGSHLLNPLGDAAMQAYQEAVNRMDQMNVPRGKAEALLGLCLAHGYRGQWFLAQSYGTQGMEIALQAGDRWMASLVRLGYGQCAVMNKVYRTAIKELLQCVEEFTEVEDPFLETAGRLWLALAMHRTEDGRYVGVLQRALGKIERHHFEFLLERPTFCGIRDLQSLVPMFRTYLEQTREAGLAAQVLQRLDGGAAGKHPGYTLRVRTLGGFRVWRGFEEVANGEWRREKAKQLFQFFVTHQGRLVHRDEICEELWGETESTVAERDFKVALNALARVLEPDKARGTSAFIVRDGSLYGLTSDSIVEVDSYIFKQRVAQADAVLEDENKAASVYESALALYQGEYLPQIRYQSWCEAERTVIQCSFVRASMNYVRMCYQREKYEEVIRRCQRVIEVDPIWEEAYAWLMRAYKAQYNRSMVAATFAQCQRVLQQELSVEPLPETRAIYLEISPPVE